MNTASLTLLAEEMEKTLANLKEGITFIESETIIEQSNRQALLLWIEHSINGSKVHKTDTMELLLQSIQESRINCSESIDNNVNGQDCYTISITAENTTSQELRVDTFTLYYREVRDVTEYILEDACLKLESTEPTIANELTPLLQEVSEDMAMAYCFGNTGEMFVTPKNTLPNEQLLSNLQAAYDHKNVDIKDGCSVYLVKTHIQHGDSSNTCESLVMAETQAQAEKYGITSHASVEQENLEWEVNRATDFKNDEGFSFGGCQLIEPCDVQAMARYKNIEDATL